MAVIKEKHALVPLNYDFSNSDVITEENTANPFESLTFYKHRSAKKNKKRSRKVILIVPILMVVSSIVFNGYFLRTLDPMVSGAQNLQSFLISPVNFVSNLANNSYVVTVGDFPSMELAKAKAIELLPMLKQVDIIQLDNGNYTFQIDRFGTEYSARKSANKLAIAGLEKVRITYVN